MSDTAKVIESQHADGTHHAWLFHCPGCDAPHCCDARWTFNGDIEAPTFRASVLVYAAGDRPRCHSFVTNGRIEFLGDSTHALAGKAVDLPAWRATHPEWQS